MSGSYNLFMRAYPKEYRTEHGSEIVGTLLEAGAPGRRIPSPREAAWLVVAGLKVRVRSDTKRSPWWSDGLHLGILALALTNLGAGLGANRTPYWLAGLVLLVVALLRGWVWLALPLALGGGFLSGLPFVFGPQHLPAIASIFGARYGGGPDSLAFWLIVVGLDVFVAWRGVAFRPEPRLRPRSWLWLAAPVAAALAGNGPQLFNWDLVNVLFVGSMLLFAIWTTAVASDARWLLATVIYLLRGAPNLFDSMFRSARFTSLDGVYWGLVGMLVLGMATAVVRARRRADRVL